MNEKDMRGAAEYLRRTCDPTINLRQEATMNQRVERVVRALNKVQLGDMPQLQQAIQQQSDNLAAMCDAWLGLQETLRTAIQKAGSISGFGSAWIPFDKLLASTKDETARHADLHAEQSAKPEASQ